MMMKLPINRSKCIVLRPHSALLPRHRLFRIWSVFHITKYTSFFLCQTSSSRFYHSMIFFHCIFSNVCQRQLKRSAPPLFSQNILREINFVCFSTSALWQNSSGQFRQNYTWIVWNFRARVIVVNRRWRQQQLLGNTKKQTNKFDYK